MPNLTVKKNIELKSSWIWIKSAFYTFRESPIHFMILSIIGIVTSILPLFGAFIAPLITARVANLAQRVNAGEKIQISTLFDGFFANATVVRLGFLNFMLNAIIFIGQYLAVTYLKSKGSAENIGLSLATLAFLLPLLFLQIAMWISPIICLNYPKISPVAAMNLSLQAGLYNITTLLLYALLVLGFTLLALLPVGLGLFIWLPVLNITSYYVYKTSVV